MEEASSDPAADARRSKADDGRGVRDPGVDAFAETAQSPSSVQGWAPLPEGTVLGGSYRLEGLIGRGGMGAVYRATHRSLRRAFAVKVVVASSDHDARGAFRLVQEARTASAIRHDHIIDVTDLGHTEQGLVYVVMELLEGEDLAQRLERQAREAAESGAPAWLPDDEVRELFDQVLDGAAAAHAAGVIHRDLKPANVFLARRGERIVPKVLDFGMSKVAAVEDGSLRLTQTGQIVGTPLYMAPEQSRGAGLDQRSDVYSLGVMMYEALSGDVPFPAETLYECILKHATEAPPSLAGKRSDLPPAVIALVEQCLSKDPAARCASAGELRVAWRSAWGRPSRDDAPVTASGESRDPDTTARLAAEAPPPEVPRRQPWWIALALGVPILATAAWLGWSSTQEHASVHSAPSEPSRSEREDPILELPAPPIEETGELVAEPTADPTDATARERTIHVDSTPSGAHVLRDGQRVGQTPFELVVQEGERVELTLRRTGFQAAQQTIDENTPERVSVELRPRARTPLIPDLAPSEWSTPGRRAPSGTR
ncbi:MAG: serine/threonine protein kinase [Sandaracinaceae bacterium]|nr:serine/threonine protein kinase [Sandaracinaceae bacterium]